jgi:WD40 repeat protein
MTMDAIRFISAFFPIISKAAMQTYISALPLMGSDTLLFKTYHTETITCRSDLQSHSPSGWVPLKAPAKWHTNRHPKTIISSSASSGYLIAEAESHPTTRVRFYDARTGNETENSFKLPSPAESMHFTPDSRHLLTIDDRGTISTWDIKKGLSVHIIEFEFKYPLIHLSANGKILVGSRKHNGFSDKFSLWDTVTAECIRTFVFNISYWHNIALSPDGRTLAVQEGNKAGIQFFDVQSGTLEEQAFVIEGRAAQPEESLSFKNVIWSSDGKFLATVSIQDNIRLWDVDKRTCTSLDSEARDGSLSPDLSFSPDNSYIAAWYSNSKSTPSHSYARIWDMQTRKIIWTGTLGPTRDYSMSFLSDSQEIIFFELNHPPIRIVRLPTYMSDPLRIYGWTSAYYIQYSHLTSSANVDFASRVDGVGWITNTAGERLMWVPYPDFELCSTIQRTELDRQRARFTQRKILEVKEPGTNTVVLRFKIDFRVEANVITHGVDFRRFQ